VANVRWLGIGAAVGILAVLASGGVPSAHERLTAVTWVRDVEPILRERCGGCHAAGGVAAPQLTDFDAATRSGTKIKAQVLSRYMPPWPAAPGFGDFANDASLTPYEIDVLVSWADAGMPRGTPQQAESPAPLPPQIEHPSEPDLLLQVDSETPVQSHRQSYMLRTQQARDRWIRGWEFRPGNDALIRQATITMEPGGPLGVWVPPRTPVFLPDGTGQKLKAGAKLHLDIEYERPPGPATDRSGVALYFSDAPVRELRHMQLRRGTSTLREDLVALAVRPQMEVAGESIRMLAERPDGHSEALLWVRSYDPRHQITYRFRRPIPLPSGTRITIFSFDGTSSADLEYVRR
jgi:hypothetical protein